MAAVNAGAVYKYITKPADFVLLRQTLTEAMNLHRETIHRDAMAETLRELEEQRQATEASEAQREQLQQRLIAASREAGRAEVATGILHNVGNVLNSMNISAAVVNNTLAESRIGNLCKGLAMLEEHANDLASFITTDERGQRLPGYLVKLAPRAVRGAGDDRQGDGIAEPQHRAHRPCGPAVSSPTRRKSCLRQPVIPTELMEDAVRVNQAARRQNGVQVVREYAQVPMLMLDQHRVLQILINLVSNAVRALKDSAAG